MPVFFLYDFLTIILYTRAWLLPSKEICKRILYWIANIPIPFSIFKRQLSFRIAKSEILVFVIFDI